MAEIGFIHEVFGFDRTYIEICQPIDPESSMGRRAARADSGFMVVIQVDDAAAMLDRAAALELTPLFTKDLHGSPISQWHPRDFGTIAEIDEMRPSDSWHFAPAIYAARSTAVVEDIVATELAVADPEAMAQRWAAVVGAPAEGTSVEVGDRVLRFSPATDVVGVISVDCRATDRGRAGETLRLCNVDFRLV
jgi:hypothetical protein